jgi:benzoate-CoA ligase
MDRHPDKTAYICGDRSMSYRELDRESRSFVRVLRERKINPGDFVVIALPDSFAFPVAFLGCLLAGVVAVAANTALSKEDFEYILKDSSARLLVTHPDLAEARDSAGNNIDMICCNDRDSFGYPAVSADDWSPYRPAAEDFAFMVYTSGSTGRPKGIPHRHQDLVLSCELWAAGMGITEDDVIFSVVKLSYSYGLMNSLALALFFGATAVLNPGKPGPGSVLRIVRDRRPTIIYSVPTMYSQIILSCTEPELRLPMRLCISGGEDLPAVMFEEWRRLTGLELTSGYGSAEMTYGCMFNPPGKARPGSVGQPVPGYDVRLVDGDGNEVSPGTAGNLIVKGPTMSPYYWNLPEKSAETMLADGYFRTGDVFVMRDGYYYYQGRSDDMIKSGAKWVSPVLVEDALLSHPAVADCAVAAVHEGTLVKPGAFVILAPGVVKTPALARELREHLLERIPDYMCPVRFEFIAELPRTATGKIQRSRLRNDIKQKGEGND